MFVLGHQRLADMRMCIEPPSREQLRGFTVGYAGKGFTQHVRSHAGTGSHASRHPVYTLFCTWVRGVSLFPSAVSSVKAPGSSSAKTVGPGRHRAKPRAAFAPGVHIQTGVLVSLIAPSCLVHRIPVLPGGHFPNLMCVQLSHFNAPGRSLHAADLR